MKLPSQTALEDAEIQLDRATSGVAPLVALLGLSLETLPTNPTHRPRYERNSALYNALKAYFAAVDNLADVHGQQVREMRLEMSRAQLDFHELGVDRDYCKKELQIANERYYKVLDLLTALQERFPNAPA